MKKIKTVMLFIILGLLLVGCGTKMAGNDASIADSSNVPNEEMDSDSAMELVNIVDLTIVNHLGTDEELEEMRDACNEIRDLAMIDFLQLPVQIKCGLAEVQLKLRV